MATIEYKVTSSDNGYSYYYYIILNDTITINFNLTTIWHSTITASTTFKIEIDNRNINDISTNLV